MNQRIGIIATVMLVCGLSVVVTGQRQAIETPEQQPPQPPSFRTGVDVVSLNVTVTDGQERFVTDLTQDDFLLYEDGVLQETTYFARRQLPIALALLIDTSASMDERMTTAQEAAIGFSRRLRPEDLAEIIDFDSRVSIRQPFTSQLEQLEAAGMGAVAMQQHQCARVFNGALLDASTLNINDGGESWLAGTPSMASLRTSMAAALMCNK